MIVRFAVAAVLALAVSGPALAYDYKAQCRAHDCRNKDGRICNTPADVMRPNGRCADYDNGWGLIVVHQQRGKACRITDSGRTGWTRCGALQYDITPRR